MTQRSYLWEGTTTGDATLAPYLKDAFNRWLFGQFINDNSTAPFVVPGYENDLKATISAGALNVIGINSGAAVVKNHLYTNDAVEYFTIDPILDSTKSYRYDSLVLQLENDKIRLAVISGVESTTYPPTAPVLTQTSLLWQVELFRVFVNSVNYTLLQEYVYDQRYFIPTNLYRQDSPRNLLRNSEFMSYFNSTGIVGAWGVLGSAWSAQGTVGVTVYAQTACLAPQLRGYSMHISNCEANIGIAQFLFVHNDMTYSVEGLVQPQDAASPVLVTLEGQDSSNTVVETRKVLVPGIATPTTMRVRFTHTFVSTEVVRVVLRITNNGTSGADYKVGQFVLSKGYFTGGLRPVNEVLMFSKPVVSTSWDGDAKSTGTTTINLAASFGNNIPAWVRGVILTLRCRDSASAGTANVNLRALSITGNIVHGQCQVGRVVNNKWRTAQCVIPIDDDLRKSGDITQWRFVLGVTATGAATLEAHVQIVGIII